MDNLSRIILQQKYKELKDGIKYARRPRITWDVVNTWRTARTYLGTDVQTDESHEEDAHDFSNGLTSRLIEKSDLFKHVTKETTQAALHVLLTIAARELVNTGNADEEVCNSCTISPDFAEQLQDPEFTGQVLETFPDGKITSSMIEEALRPAA